MVEFSIVNETSPEANWQLGGQTGKPMCREAAPPKIAHIFKNDKIIIILSAK